MNIEEQSFAGWFAKNLRNQPKDTWKTILVLSCLLNTLMISLT